MNGGPAELDLAGEIYFSDDRKGEARSECSGAQLKREGSNDSPLASESFPFIIRNLSRRFGRILGRNREFRVNQRIARGSVQTLPMHVMGCLRRILDRVRQRE